MIDERTLVLWLAISLSSPSTVKAFVEGLYCGRQSCYDVLGVTRDSSKQEISKAYRKLAIKYHPDKVKGDEEAKKEAQKKFQKIATAYETLKDDEARNDYDYMLDNPEEMYRHYYYYYRRRLSPKVDVRIVILVAILAVSIVQYVSAWHKYNEAVAYLLTDPKYRLKATEMAREQGLLTNLNKKGQRRDKKEQIKEQEEAIIRQVIEENVDIHGGYRKPKVYDVCAFQLVFLPWYLVQLIYFYAKWFWKFGICRHEYGDEEKLYLIRRNFGMSEVQFNEFLSPVHSFCTKPFSEAMSEHEKEDYLELELWQNSKFAEWKAAKEESERQKLLSRSGAYKRQLRYMRKGGAGQITFLDDE